MIRNDFEYVYILSLYYLKGIIFADILELSVFRIIELI